ncbi:hypothetical protein ACVKN3_002869 [Luteibacter sp. PvP120]
MRPSSSLHNSPADVSALRAALSADPNVSQRLDTQAASGALHGFALAAAGAPDRPVGSYDRTAGTMTLPSSAFSGSHHHVGAVLRVQAMIAEFGGRTYAENAGASHPDTIHLEIHPGLSRELSKAKVVRTGAR